MNIKIWLRRPRNILALSLGLLCLGFGYLFLYEPSYKGLIDPSGDPLVFAHRGFGNHAPDNSLIGAKIALTKGMDGVDVDAQFSKDQAVVIFHDVDLDRFTTGTGRVDAHTLEEIQAYDLAIKYGDPEFAEVFVATFEDFVKEITPEAKLMVELKVPSPKDTGIEKEVSRIIKKYQAHKQVYISAFNPVVLRRLKKIDAQIQTVFIFMDSGWDPKRVAETKPEDRVSLPWFVRNETARRAIRKFIKPDALSINHQVPTAVTNRLINKGYPVFIWSVDTPETISSALKKSPFGLVTNEPLLTKNIRDQFIVDQ